MQFTKLPFYPVEQLIYSPKLLSSPSSVPVNKPIRLSIPINLSAENVSKLTCEGNDLPKYEIQFRVGTLDKSGIIKDEYPSYLVLRMNDSLVQLPQYQKFPCRESIQGYVEKRLPMPVNLTFHYDHSKEVAQHLTVDWKPEAKKFSVGVWLVHHVNADFLQKQFTMNLNENSCYEETRNAIKQNLCNKDGDDITTDSLKISLICPMSRVRMTVPVKGKECKHLQCFDLSNYLKMNELRGLWKCPICNHVCLADSLVFDRYFDEIIKKVSKSVNDVKLLPDGGWAPIQHETLSTSNRPKRNRKATFGSSSGYVTASTQLSSSSLSKRQKVNDITLITIDSDDEHINTTPAVMTFSQSNQRKRIYSQTEPARIQANTTVIVLSDSDEE